MSLRNLILFLMFGGVLYGIYYLYHTQSSRPLRAELIAIDTARVTRLRIHPKEVTATGIELQRQGDYWIASNGQVHLRALEPPVQALLRNLVRITTVDVTAQSEDDWMHYGLAPGQAVRVEVYEDDKLKEDFWVGQNRSEREEQDNLSFIRMHESPEVYAVKGLETYPFHQEFPIYRPKTILSLPPDQLLDSFSYIFPDTIFTFRRTEGAWRLGDKTVADAAQIGRFLENLRNVHADIYVDDFDESQLAEGKYRSLLLYLPQAEKPVLIDAYWDTLRPYPYILQSTQNPGSWFGSDSSGVYSRLFWEVEVFGNEQ